MLAIACTNTEKVTVTSAPTTLAGAPSTFDGALRVTVQSGDGTVEQDEATPLAFKAVSGPAPGVTVFLVEADVQRGDGVILIQETVELTVSDENAAAFGLTAGVVEPK